MHVADEHSDSISITARSSKGKETVEFSLKEVNVEKPKKDMKDLKDSLVEKFYSSISEEGFSPHESGRFIRLSEEDAKEVVTIKHFQTGVRNGKYDPLELLATYTCRDMVSTHKAPFYHKVSETAPDWATGVFLFRG